MIELDVAWEDGGVGKGTLKTAQGGKTQTRPVRVSAWKGIVLIDDPNEKRSTVHIGLFHEDDPKKWIQIGDDKTPQLPCE